jgi:hypothetical protein
MIIGRHRDSRAPPHPVSPAFQAQLPIECPSLHPCATLRAPLFAAIEVLAVAQRFAALRANAGPFPTSSQGCCIEHFEISFWLSLRLTHRSAPALRGLRLSYLRGADLFPAEANIARSLGPHDP